MPTKESKKFFKIVYSQPIESVVFDQDMLQASSFPKSTDIKVDFKKSAAEEKQKELISPEALPISTIINNFAVFFSEEAFSYFQENYAHLISPYLIQLRKDARKMQSLISRETISEITISPTREHISPPNHIITISWKNGRKSTIDLSPRSTANLFTEFLDLESYLYVKKYLPQEKEEQYTSQKLRAIVEDEHFSHVQISGNSYVICFKNRRFKEIKYLDQKVAQFLGVYMDFRSYDPRYLPSYYQNLFRMRLALISENFSHVHLVNDETVTSDYKLIFTNKDGSHKSVSITTEMFELFTEFFAVYFDEVSFNSPDVQNLITEETKAAYLAKQEKDRTIVRLSEILKKEDETSLHRFFKQSSAHIDANLDGRLHWLEGCWRSEKRFLLEPKMSEFNKIIKDIQISEISGVRDDISYRVAITHLDESKETVTLEQDEIYEQFGIYLNDKDFEKGEKYEKPLYDSASEKVKEHYTRCATAYAKAKAEREIFDAKHSSLLTYPLIAEQKEDEEITKTATL